MSKCAHFIRLGNEAMNIELTTADDTAEVRQMISAWTDSLLRLRSRPGRTPQRGERRFTASAADSASDLSRPQPRFNTDAVFGSTLRAVQ
jgi:hypothetical protein